MKSLGQILEVTNLSKSFDGIRAVDDLSFDVSDQDTLALLGPNGAGKSTLINLLTGVYSPGHGNVRFQGKDIVGLRMHEIAQRGIVRTFQRSRLFDELSVLDNLSIGAIARNRISLGVIMSEAGNWLKRLNLQTFRNMQARSLPFGHKRLLEIGRAMMARPQLLILDEPGAGMSVDEQAFVVGLLKEIRQAGTVLMFVEHVSHVILSLATRVIVLHYGRKIYDGDPTQMALEPEVQKIYYGRSGLNVSVGP
jgi:branched-chain amino acid transport system ATP-binding protein